MTKYRKKVVKHVEVEESYKEMPTICDICNRSIDKVARETNNNSVDVELKAEIGNVWEGGEADVREGYRVDACNQCFMDKIMPAIEAIGVRWHNYRPEEAWSVNNKYSDYWEDWNL